MINDVQLAMKSLRSIAAIRDHVRDVLCEHDRLDPGQSEVRQARIMRGGNECGLMFQVCGPRQLRSYAVWAGAEQRILFYESTGNRFAETKIVDGPNAAESLKAAA